VAIATRGALLGRGALAAAAAPAFGADVVGAASDGPFARAPSGALERAPSGALERAPSGALERAPSGALE
jgi:hypothetical protein